MRVRKWAKYIYFDSIYMVSDDGIVIRLGYTTINKKGYLVNKKDLVLKQTNHNGYKRVVLISGRKQSKVLVHTLMAYCFLDHKSNSKLVVDHINNVKNDNRLENLQLISHRKNASKDQKRKSNILGVYKHTNSHKWRSDIQINGRLIYLGLYKTPEIASKIHTLAVNNIKLYKNSEQFRNLLKDLL